MNSDGRESCLAMCCCFSNSAVLVLAEKLRLSETAVRSCCCCCLRLGDGQNAAATLVPRRWKSRTVDERDDMRHDIVSILGSCNKYLPSNANGGLWGGGWSDVGLSGMRFCVCT